MIAACAAPPANSVAAAKIKHLFISPAPRFGARQQLASRAVRLPDLYGCPNSGVAQLRSSCFHSKFLKSSRPDSEPWLRAFLASRRHSHAEHLLGLALRDFPPRR
jgi:hypothetical protein